MRESDYHRENDNKSKMNIWRRLLETNSSLRLKATENKDIKHF